MVDLPTSRAEWATEKLRQAIVFGELKPGERLRGSFFAEQWMVSATPLREAFQRLTAEGLVDYTAQQGVRVAGVSMRELREIYELRVMLEPIAVERSLRNVDGSWRDAVDEAYARLRAVFDGGLADMSSFEEANQAFHKALRSRCDSAWLLRIVDVLADHSVRYRLLSWLPRGGDAEILREHEEIYKACITGQIERAVQLSAQHIKLTVDSVDGASNI